MCHFCIVSWVGDNRLNNTVCVPHAVVIPPVSIIDQIEEGTMVTQIIVFLQTVPRLFVWDTKD